MVAGSQVSCHSAFCRDNKKVAPFAGAVVVPMAEKQMFKDDGFHFRIGTFLVAEFVASVVHAAGKDFRYKDNVLAVRRPDSAIGFRGDAGDLLWPASGHPEAESKPLIQTCEPPSAALR